MQADPLDLELSKQYFDAIEPGRSIVSGWDIPHLMHTITAIPY
jgi:hypothetical protein